VHVWVFARAREETVVWSDATVRLFTCAGRQCLICELAQADLWNAINEFPSAANTIYNSLKLQAVHHVTMNKGQMCTVETHPSALQENLDPLSALNLSERRQRILQWHKHYESEDWQASSQDQNEFVDIANGELDPIKAAMKISGVSDHVVAIIREMDMFKGAPARAQAQVIAKLVMVKFCKGEVVIQVRRCSPLAPAPAPPSPLSSNTQAFEPFPVVCMCVCKQR